MIDSEPKLKPILLEQPTIFQTCFVFMPNGSLFYNKEYILGITNRNVFQPMIWFRNVWIDNEKNIYPFSANQSWTPNLPSNN